MDGESRPRRCRCRRSCARCRHDPASEAAFADLKAALEQLQARGDQHARYFDDCRGVWLAVEESPLVKEKDPVFCLRDLALMIKKAEKRYADDERFKGLSAPIAKRCGKRPK